MFSVLSGPNWFPHHIETVVRPSKAVHKKKQMADIFDVKGQSQELATPIIYIYTYTEHIYTYTYIDLFTGAALYALSSVLLMIEPGRSGAGPGRLSMQCSNVTLPP